MGGIPRQASAHKVLFATGTALRVAHAICCRCCHNTTQHSLATHTHTIRPPCQIHWAAFALPPFVHTGLDIAADHGITGGEPAPLYPLLQQQQQQGPQQHQQGAASREEVVAVLAHSDSVATRQAMVEAADATQGLGKHVIGELHGVAYAALDNQALLEDVLQRAAVAGRLTVLSSHFHKFSPHGVTGILVLAESHMSVRLEGRAV